MRRPRKPYGFRMAVRLNVRYGSGFEPGPVGLPVRVQPGACGCQAFCSPIAGQADGHPLRRPYG